MPTNKRTPYQKQFNRDKHDYEKRKDDYCQDEKIRVLQDKLIFVNGLTHEMSDRSDLQKPQYFAKYGSILKLIINPNIANRRGTMYQAYVTYETQLEAAMAIVALDGFRINQKPLKVSYGTTKYCNHFLRGYECPNDDCFFLHNFDRKKQVNNSDNKSLFKEQNNHALNVVLQNLQQVVQKAFEEQSDDEAEDEGFPSIKQLLQNLVEDNEITQNELDTLYQTHRGKQDQQIQMPKLQNRVMSLNISPQNRQPQIQKLVKSNSHSTMNTPIKIAEEELKEQMNHNTNKVQNISKELPKIDKVVPKQIVVNKELKIQEKIQKLILKQMLKKANGECRSRFLKNITASKEECSRIRKIVQKHLINSN